MKVIFEVDRLEHIEEKSFYNHNYYKLPYSIDGCLIVYQEWTDDSFEGYYYLGNFDEKGNFKAKHCFYGNWDGEVDLISNRENI